MMKWYNIELNNNESEDLKMILNQYNVKYETSQADNMTHFEIYTDKTTASAINDCLDMCRLINR